MIPWLAALATALQLGGATVRVTNVRSDASGCRATLDFHRAGGKPRRLWSGNMDAVGLAAGLFIPERQPSRHYATIVKSGDYEGLLLFVRRDGSLVTHPGGWFWIDRPHQLLFSIDASDDPQAVVIDLHTLRRVGGDAVLAPEAFYRDGARVFVAGRGADGERAFEFDFTKRVFVRVRPERSRWTRLAWDFDLATQPHCGSR